MKPKHRILLTAGVLAALVVLLGCESTETMWTSPAYPAYASSGYYYDPYLYSYPYVYYDPWPYGSWSGSVFVGGDFDRDRGHHGGFERRGGFEHGGTGMHHGGGFARSGGHHR